MMEAYPTNFAKIYAIESTGPRQAIMSVGMNKSHMEKYLKVYQQTTSPEHWRLVELKVNLDELPREAI